MARRKADDSTFICMCCGKEKTVSSFGFSYSPHHKNGKLPACRDCVKKLYSTFAFNYDDQQMAMKRLCMFFDIYWSYDIFSSVDLSKDDVVGNYLSRIKKRYGRSFEDSINEGFDMADTIDDERIERSKEESEPQAKMSPPALIKKWGSGFAPDEYQTLEDHYKYLKNANPNCDSNQEIFIIDLCYTKMQQLKAVQQGRVDDYNKLTESYNKSFKTAGLKTTKDMNEEEFSIGVSIEQLERYTPAEYYRDQKLYSDHDSIKDYVERFMLRPLRNLMHGTKDRDFEYYIKDDEGDLDGS